jgi:ribosomal protein S27AE
VTTITDARQTKKRMCPQCGAALPWPDYADVAVCASCGSTLVADAVLRALQCPQCAGFLAVVDSTRLLACCHCGVQLLVASNGSAAKWRLPVRTDCDQARRAAHNWLRNHPGVARTARENRLTQAELVYVPIWEYRALVAGWEFGHRTRLCAEIVGDKNDPRLELRRVREAVEDGHLQERRSYQAATDLAAIGAVRPRMTGREPLLPVLAGDLDSGRVLPVQIGQADILEQGRRRAHQPASETERATARVFILHEAVALLFYPLWRLRYRHGGRSYHMAVNAFDGTVNTAFGPASTLERIRGRLAALTVAGGRPDHGTVEYHDPFSS